MLARHPHRKARHYVVRALLPCDMRVLLLLLSCCCSLLLNLFLITSVAASISANIGYTTTIPQIWDASHGKFVLLIHPFFLSNSILSRQLSSSSKRSFCCFVFFPLDRAKGNDKVSKSSAAGRKMYSLLKC
ncbi:hypothetical protein BDB00DRAFT_830732, partial [Zychaea mexicana]|uniref:uncharacterized protein n=1 Tax=Zychaea mexicana TaxID=64656 RepID=UPI0022FE9A79